MTFLAHWLPSMAVVAVLTVAALILGASIRHEQDAASSHPPRTSSKHPAT